jgi:M6 family metalloprotease-like protein
MWHRRIRRQVQQFDVLRSWIFVVLVSFLLPLQYQVDANVAYPGIWTALQPNGDSTGTEQMLIGTAEYHFAVVETEASFYPTIRDADGWIQYATRGKDGRYLPTNILVDRSSDPDTHPHLQKAVHENRHVVHAKCMERDFCKWRELQKLQETPTVLATQGSILNLVIPFQFSDHASRALTSIHDLDNFLFNGPKLSVKDYFDQQSYGKLDVVSELTPWVQIPYTEQECAGKLSGLTLSLHTCLEAAMEQASKLLSEWDTVLKSAVTVTFVHSGYAAEFGGNDVDGQWYEDRLWSHAWELESPIYQGRYALISDKYDRKNSRMNRVGVAVHELAQALGAMPLYGEYPGYGLGYYDMLANPWGFDGTLTHCGSMSPYTKNLFGWVDVEIIDSDGTYQLTQSYESNKVYMIQRGFPEGEYLLIENRQEEGYDKGLNQPGLAIFHVDLQANNAAGHPQKRDFPVDHYVVTLLQGDGRYDLERMEDEGDSGDLFHAGRFTGVCPDGAYRRDGTLSPHGHPNTNSYQSGREKSTGVSILDISASSRIMSFRVAFS